ncbi:MAG: phosphotransferase enzyme family protein [Oceanihabitans sp.]
MVESIKKIGEQFAIEGTIKAITTLVSGHINDTYLVTTTTNKKYVLQKINAQVFKNVPALLANKLLVSAHLQKMNSNYKVVEFIKSIQEDYFVLDQDLQYWNMMLFIENAITHDLATSSKLVYYAGKLYGDFIVQTASMQANKLTEILQDFHSVPVRYKQFDQALLQAKTETINLAKEEIDFIQNCMKEMQELSFLKENNNFPIRVTHNDAKLSNILFNKNEEGLAVIDLDTVMPGIVHFDFGDSVRSICATATEDETELQKVSMNLEFYKAYCKGFAESTNNMLTKTEIEHLPLGAKTITFIMGLRFLTDYLNNNTYYKVKYELHNLDRAKN